MRISDIDLADYDYDLPSERIAQYPVAERDLSNLLIADNGVISKDIFRNIENYLPSKSVLVFNNTRVIRARIIFRKETGAVVEVFCIEPLLPSEYEMSFASKEPVEWKCLIGNLKKWKGEKLVTSFSHKGGQYNLYAERVQSEAEAWRVRFTWNCSDISFSEVIEATGHIPLPPYINREDEEDDNIRYQTVFSSIKGSVAAPTAGLHFTDRVLKNLEKKGIKSIEITLHVGAGTFQPVKSSNITDHRMHCEHFFVTSETIMFLLNNKDKIIPVGTTSVRTLESLYWLGVKALKSQSDSSAELTLGQWEAYDLEKNVSVKDSMRALLNILKKRDLPFLHASTSMMIIPGYEFKMTEGMITNFHQPRSTLLLLISAWIGNQWKEIYTYAIRNDIRFLSFGDCSLLLRQ